MEPRRNHIVIFSSSNHHANRMVVIGLKYTQLVATTAIPRQAITEPSAIIFVTHSDLGYTSFSSSIANIGQVQTISEVFVAVVYTSEAFSVRKYNDPPVTPSSSINTSSLTELYCRAEVPKAKPKIITNNLKTK